MYVPDDEIPEEIRLTDLVDGFEQLNMDKWGTIHPGVYKYLNAFEPGLPRRIRHVDDGKIVFLNKFALRVYIYNCSYDWLCGARAKYLHDKSMETRVREWYWERLKVYVSSLKRSLKNHFPEVSLSEAISQQGKPVTNKVRIYEITDLSLINVALKDLKKRFLWRDDNNKLNL